MFTKPFQVTCIDVSDKYKLKYSKWTTAYNLTLNQVYTVIGENTETDYMLEGVVSSWAKRRFVRFDGSDRKYPLRVTLRLSQEDIDNINIIANGNNITRSQLISDLVSEKLHKK